jgi:hypothetical protein
MGANSYVHSVRAGGKVVHLRRSGYDSDALCGAMMLWQKWRPSPGTMMPICKRCKKRAV